MVVKNTDPAADFLAREQEQLGELEVDIGTLAVSPHKSPVPFMEKKIKEEPEVIKQWREKQAAKELAAWYEQNAIQLEKLRATNREAMINANKTFVAELEPVEPGTEWDRVAKLCDFNPKSAKNVKDVSRMRSIILQLKQGPAPTSSN